MNPRIAEILIHLLRHIAESGAESELFLEGFIEELIGTGYDPEDVRQAVSWLNERSVAGTAGPVSDACNAESRRILHNAETHYLTPEARSLLAEVQNEHELQPGETEALIERAIWAVRSHSSIEDLREFAQQMVLVQGSVEPGQEFRMVAPGASSQH